MDCIEQKFFDSITPEIFDSLLPEILKRDWEFLLKVSYKITDDQNDILQPHILDKFITDQFEQAEWEGRFQILEDAKEIYAKELFGDEPSFVKYNISNYQSIFISKDYSYDVNDTLVIPVNLFRESDLAPMEIIVWVLKTSWNKSYSTIAKMLGRDARNIETTFKRAVAKMESD